MKTIFFFLLLASATCTAQSTVNFAAGSCTYHPSLLIEGTASFRVNAMNEFLEANMNVTPGNNGTLPSFFQIRAGKHIHSFSPFVGYGVMVASIKAGENNYITVIDPSPCLGCYWTKRIDKDLGLKIEASINNHFTLALNAGVVCYLPAKHFRKITTHQK